MALLRLMLSLDLRDIGSMILATQRAVSLFLSIDARSYVLIVCVAMIPHP